MWVIRNKNTILFQSLKSRDIETELQEVKLSLRREIFKCFYNFPMEILRTKIGERLIPRGLVSSLYFN